MKVPTQPPLDGLPVWAQIVISLIVGIATLAVAFKGYFAKEKSHVVQNESRSATVLAATIADMGAVRNLSDCVIRLDASVQALTKAIDEGTHFERNNNEVGRELCARLRELREALERK